MSSELNNIEFPSLLDANFADSVKEQFSNINQNFEILAGQDIYKGPAGEVMESHPLYFFDTETITPTSKLTAIGSLVMRLIYDQVESADLTIDLLWTTAINSINEIYPPNESNISITSHFDDSNCFWEHWGYVLDDSTYATYSPITPYIFIDKRITSNDSSSLVDNTCTLMGTNQVLKITETNIINDIYYTRGNLFPGLYFDNTVSADSGATVGAWCWLINGVKTKIKAQGLPGPPATAADIVIYKIDKLGGSDAYWYFDGLDKDGNIQWNLALSTAEHPEVYSKRALLANGALAWSLSGYKLEGSTEETFVLSVSTLNKPEGVSISNSVSSIPTEFSWWALKSSNAANPGFGVSFDESLFRVVWETLWKNLGSINDTISASSGKSFNLYMPKSGTELGAITFDSQNYHAFNCNTSGQTDTELNISPRTTSFLDSYQKSINIKGYDKTTLTSSTKPIKDGTESIKIASTNKGDVLISTSTDSSITTGGAGSINISTDSSNRSPGSGSVNITTNSPNSATVFQGNVSIVRNKSQEMTSQIILGDNGLDITTDKSGSTLNISTSSATNSKIVIASEGADGKVKLASKSGILMTPGAKAGNYNPDINLTQASLMSMMSSSPKGTIITWSGFEYDIPYGWLPCCFLKSLEQKLSNVNPNTSINMEGQQAEGLAKLSTFLTTNISVPNFIGTGGSTTINRLYNPYLGTVTPTPTTLFDSYKTNYNGPDRSPVWTVPQRPKTPPSTNPSVTTATYRTLQYGGKNTGLPATLFFHTNCMVSSINGVYVPDLGGSMVIGGGVRSMIYTPIGDPESVGYKADPNEYLNNIYANSNDSSYAYSTVSIMYIIKWI